MTIPIALANSGDLQVELIEIMELTDGTSGMGSFVRDAAKEWDGSDPVRTIG